MFRLKITVKPIFTEIYFFKLNVAWDANVVQDTKCHTGQSFILSIFHFSGEHIEFITKICAC